MARAQPGKRIADNAGINYLRFGTLLLRQDVGPAGKENHEHDSLPNEQCYEHTPVQICGPHIESQNSHLRKLTRQGTVGMPDKSRFSINEKGIFEHISG